MIWCVGDSLTVGAWFDQSFQLQGTHSYAETLGQLLDEKILVVARSGARCSDILDLVKETHRTRRALPRLAVVLAGTNDSMLSALEMGQKIWSIHDYFHSHSVPTVVITPPCCGSKYGTVNGLLLGWLARPLVWAHVDTARLLDPTLLCHDLTHFLPSGSRVLGATLASVVNALFFSRLSCNRHTDPTRLISPRSSRPELLPSARSASSWASSWAPASSWPA
jgi:hypothetical protein